MSKLISGKIKKVPPTEVSADRYDFIQLSETEPDLGVPAVAGYVLSSDTTGDRSWIAPGLGATGPTGATGVTGATDLREQLASVQQVLLAPQAQLVLLVLLDLQDLMVQQVPQVQLES